jgi:hypothetical protein
MLAVVSGGFDINLANVSGSYVSAGRLQHYWRPGANPDNFGEDYAGTLDLNKLHAVTSGNITLDTP